MEPVHFGKNLRGNLEKLVRLQLEGTVLPSYGLLLKIVTITLPSETATTANTNDSTLPLIEHDTGSVHFTIEYEGLFFRGFKGEVVDFEVAGVSDIGFFGYIGPMRIVVSHHNSKYQGERREEAAATAEGKTGILANERHSALKTYWKKTNTHKFCLSFLLCSAHNSKQPSFCSHDLCIQPDTRSLRDARRRICHPPWLRCQGENTWLCRRKRQLPRYCYHQREFLPWRD